MECEAPGTNLGEMIPWLACDSGTEVAKEAADIVIMDDNFKSIVKSVLWGRSVFNNIRKFLQFQLTINFVALVVAFVAAVSEGDTPLNVLQLLWVNLIMDALGALGIAHT
jgi:P-type Ca2+ transporter type 2C